MVKEINVAAVLLMYTLGVVSVFAGTLAIRAVMDRFGKAYELQEDGMEGYVL